MASVPMPIQSTAGAIPVLNEKGELSMQKVKVHRYVSGKRPEYAPESSSAEESDDEFPFDKKSVKAPPSPEPKDIPISAQDDRRLRRLQQREVEVNAEERIERHRHIHEPEVIETPQPEEREKPRRWRHDDEESSEEEELNEEQLEERRALLRQKAREQIEKEEELLDVEEEGKSEAEVTEEESEYEEYTDSEEDTGPRLKPVFVRKRDRVTVQEKERNEKKQRELEADMKRLAEERRRQTLKIVEDEARKELQNNIGTGTVDPSDAIDSGDDNDEAEYETWKLRELKRIKRDRDEREMHEKDRLEIERLHSLTEEERRADQRANPRFVTNKAAKGKYKFLQKYFHRGAFFMNDEQGVFKRDFTQPTLEDHFDKTILPKVMQVKNFGRSGRTKYTHLVDQDTTQFDSPWVQETAQNLKFHTNQSGGMKQWFDRPSTSKLKKNKQ